jgi:FAD/FMN-containing dehydrogenase
LLERCRDIFPSLSLFEFFDDFCLDVVIESHRLSNPFTEKYPGYILLDIENCTSSDIEEGLSQLLEEGILCDVVIAQGSKQKQDLLNYRELISETLSSSYSIHKNDISVPLSTLAEFIQKLPRVLLQIDQRLEVGIFGHLGDGNLHLNYVKPTYMKETEFSESCKIADEAVYSLIKSLGGSISAEHGVGLLKLPYLSYTQSSIESALMADIKRAFDQHGILNPGILLPSSFFSV